MKKASVYLRMARPTECVTAIGDILAGVAIAGRFESGLDKAWLRIVLLSLSGALIYAGGVVYNDIFDAFKDASDHLKRAIPSGTITVGQAKILGYALFFIGIIIAGVTDIVAGSIALTITFFALIYDKWGKQNVAVGPLFLGLCRGLNLLLGLSIVPFELQNWCLLGLVPIVYMYAVSIIRHGAASRGTKQDLQIGAVLYAVVLGAILYQANINGEMELTGVFLTVFALLIFIPLSGAIQQPFNVNITKAAKAGMRSFILMDAAWAVTFDSWLAAFIIVCLYLMSLWLAKVFAVA